MPVIPNAPVKFTDAIDYLRNKTRLPTRAWTDVWQGHHAKAFVVAGAMKADLIADFHNAVVGAIENGTTLDQFRKDFDSIVAKHGWSYKGGRGWRSKVIFQTNIDQAYNAGRWKQAQEMKARRPYLRYVAVDDGRTRQQHKDWHGTILPVDHVWWQTHHPKNGWNCRCSTQSVSEDDLRRYGWKVSEAAPPVEMETRSISTPEGKTSISVPKGIDPGFAYNPGMSAFGGELKLELQAGRREFEALKAPFATPQPLDAIEAVKTGTKLGPSADTLDDMRRSLRRAIGGDEVIFDDPAGGSVVVNQALADHYWEDTARRGAERERYFPFIREIIEDPQEIWAGFEVSEKTGRVRLRKRYVKLIDLPDGGRLLMVADQEKGLWQALTMFDMESRYVKKVRTGLRIYKKGSGKNQTA